MGQSLSTPPILLFSSLLKPCDEVRLSRRLFPVMSKQYPGVRIISIGPAAGGDNPKPGLETYGLFPYERDLISRLKNSWKLFRFSLKVKPKLIAVNTTELLWIGTINKILFGSVLVFDLQENEALNRACKTTHPALALPAAASAILFYLFKPWVDRFWIAEEVYREQLRLPKSKTTYLPNVLPSDANSILPKDKPMVAEWLLTGTISIPFGALQALDWCKELRSTNPKGRLLIAGHCPDQHLKEKLEKEAENNSWILVQLSHTPVPHTHIWEYINTCEWVLAPYQDLKCIRGKHPSKFREAAAASKPVLSPDFEEWMQFKHVNGPIKGTLLLLPDQTRVMEEASQFEKDLKHELKFLDIA